MDECQHAMAELRNIVEGISKLRDTAYAHYSLLVEQVLKDQITDEQQLEQIMDGLCDFCDEIRFIDLYGTYEAIGPHFRANPYNLDADVLKPHGKDIVELDRSFEGIRTYLETHVIEGIVFWKDGHPRCKIKRKDFGFPWGR